MLSQSVSQSLGSFRLYIYLARSLRVFRVGSLRNSEIDDWAFSQTVVRKLSEAKAGASLGADSSMLKYYGTELNKRRYELLMDAAGHEGLEWESDRTNDGELARSWLRTKGNSIEGGTSEVQLNIISKHILKLPGA